MVTASIAWNKGIADMPQASRVIPTKRRGRAGVLAWWPRRRSPLAHQRGAPLTCIATRTCVCATWRDGQREVADGRASPSRDVVSEARLGVADSVDARGVDNMTEVARLAAGRYGISPGFGLHQYPLTENWTFRIEPDAAPPVVLRIYRPGGRSTVEIQSELAWMSALQQDSPALLPDVIPALSGAAVLEVVREPLDRCYCVLFSCAPGSEPEGDQLAAWFPRLGAITARLHRHARG